MKKAFLVFIGMVFVIGLFLVSAVQVSAQCWPKTKLWEQGDPPPPPPPPPPPR